MTNTNLHKAKANRLDEFYTLLPDIRDEVSRYRTSLEGRVVYSPCDGPYSNFVAYFLRHTSINVREYLHCATDFRSPDSLLRLERADVVITNPPFSLIGEFLRLLLQKEKDFLIVAPLTACHRKETFNLIKEGKLRLGHGFRGGKSRFRVPDHSEYRNHKRYDPSTGLVTFGNIVWLTNMEYDLWPGEDRNLVKPTRKYDPEAHLCFDNYHAINVDKVADIPCDYVGVMGVPITYLEKHDPKQFAIVGITTNWGIDNFKLRVPDAPKGAPLINGKAKYVRVLIKRLGNANDKRQPAEGERSP